MAKLLAGGNPQIAKADGNAPVQAYIDAMPEWKRTLGRRIDKVVSRAVPGVRKAVKWNSPFNGASLRPVPPGESKQKDVRYLDIREGEGLDDARLAAWAKQASKLPGWGGS